MNRIFTYNIQANQEPLTIQDFLKSLGYSHAIIANLKRTPNGILKNGIWARTCELLIPNDCLTITLIEVSVSHNIVPVKLPLHILYEDQDLMVINKSSNTPIHPSQGNYENTLANAVAYYYAQKDEPFVYRCINRLDRDTTGLLILAKHMYSASLLSHMIQHREIHREYLALATGLVDKEGVIDAPIGRVEGSTIERKVDFLNGEFALTTYRRLAYKNGYSLVALTLATGRTHQIRVHMNYIGHPLPGDFLYFPDYTKIQRQALHSYRLSFYHPITHIWMEFHAPLPNDMLSILHDFH
ncbi:MAG: RluA family pseudouridine synthase [Lachnospiraceae bacterium]